MPPVGISAVGHIVQLWQVLCPILEPIIVAHSRISLWSWMSDWARRQTSMQGSEALPTLSKCRVWLHTLPRLLSWKKSGVQMYKINEWIKSWRGKTRSWVCWRVRGHSPQQFYSNEEQRERTSLIPVALKILWKSSYSCGSCGFPVLLLRYVSCPFCNTTYMLSIFCLVPGAPRKRGNKFRSPSTHQSCHFAKMKSKQFGWVTY